MGTSFLRGFTGATLFARQVFNTPGPTREFGLIAERTASGCDCLLAQLSRRSTRQGIRARLRLMLRPIMQIQRLTLVFFVAFVSNVIGCRFGYAVAHQQVWLVLMLGFFLPLMQAFNSALFIEAKTRVQRVHMALVVGFATAMAGAVVTLFLT
jgi:hypothetical protein